MKELIADQKIRIDHHKRGTGEVNNWDDPAADVHVHKTTNTRYGGKQVTATIKLPINSDRPPDFKVHKCSNPQFFGRLNKEIKKALENKIVREKFVQDILDIQKNYLTKLSTKDLALGAIRKIAKHLELPSSITHEMESYVDNKLTAVTTVHTDILGKAFFISLNRKYLEAGEVPEYFQNGERLIRYLKSKH